MRERMGYTGINDQPCGMGLSKAGIYHNLWPDKAVENPLKRSHVPHFLWDIYHWTLQAAMKIGVPNQRANFGKIAMLSVLGEFKWLLLVFVFALEPLLTSINHKNLLDYFLTIINHHWIDH